MKNVNRAMNVRLRIATIKINHRSQCVRSFKKLILIVNSMITVNLDYVSHRKWHGTSLQWKYKLLDLNNVMMIN